MSEIPAVLRRYMNGLKTRNVPLVASTVSDELAFVSPGRTLSKAQFLDMLNALYAAFPDWHYDHSPPEVKDGVFTIQWCQGGTHSGTFAMPGFDPIEATGRTVTIPKQYFFYQIRDDEIREIRPEALPDGAPWGILAQIGATERG